jgi:hypothetical protein
MKYQARKQQELFTTRETVRQLMEANEDARNSDSVLILLYLEAAGVNTWGKFKMATRGNQVNFESIRRARQFIQQKGELLPTDETVRKRRRLQIVFEALAAQNKRELKGK